ncbi:MAG: M6 family metalloprotease domain-containing protein [Bacteroidaceae bacterium]|nr:M6 family metalloprotease domain-containing protein [Bacteroidaceae bacterium]
MKKLFILSFLIAIGIVASAVPVQRHRFTLRLVDGSEAVVFFAGDEHNSWLQTTDGRIVDEVAPNRFAISQRTVADERAKLKSRRRQLAVEGRHRIGSQATAPLPSIGSPKVPVVLVNFTDSVFTVAPTDEEVRAYYDLYCNGTRDGNLYQGHNSYGSIRDYFSDQSDGQFTPEFVVMGPVTVSREESYYGRNNSALFKDARYNEFTKEAIALATQIYDGDWSDFDNRGMGQVDMVFFIFAGCGENSSHVSTDIWPKEVKSRSIINGITFATSACCSEKAASVKLNEERTGYIVTGSKVDGIGVMCHELSHALGLPDFYNTNYESFGMDLWSLMDYGCYAGNGARPCGYTAYEREFMGWRQMETLDEAGWVTIQPLEAGGKGMKVVNDENPDEYYVLENRQAVAWDGSLARMGHGLQVTHVDFLQSEWNSNSVNSDVDHQRMTIIAANNRYIGTYLDDVSNNDLILTWSGNLYPYISKAEDGTVIINDSLTAYSVPAATVYTASGFMNKDIHAIRENEDLSVSLYFGNDFVDAIAEVRPSEQAGSSGAFDLTGRRVSVNASVLRSGVYVIDGRKVLVK